MFQKKASVTPLGAFTTDADGVLSRVAGKRTASYYLDGESQIDVKGILSRVASKYAISDNPSDYVYEAIRANTVNVPNDNHDGFHRNEMLRVNTRTGSAVYLSYREKPHHVNHRTENPKTARGVILDAHYNDSTPPLEHCPTKGCNTRTAERQNRDASGIHCIKCNAAVKDEFVEILVAIDARKDKAFADGVMSGELNAGSMGCQCQETECNVCKHVASSRHEFCDHIARHKGSLWTRSAERNDWRKISSLEAERELSRRGMAFEPRDFCSLTAPDGFEVRKAFEYCLGVEFEEYSRVDQPADPKALQRSVLNRAAAASEVVPSPEELRAESEQMIARARRQRRAAARSKQAMKFVVVRVDGDPLDTYAAETLEQAIELAMPDEGSKLEMAEVEAPDAGAARLMEDLEWQPVDGDESSSMDLEAGDVTINVDAEPPEGAPPVHVDEAPTDTMEDFTEQELDPEPAIEGPQESSPEELGILPPGASKHVGNLMSYADTYSDWQIKLSKAGSATLFGANGKPFVVFPPARTAELQKNHRAYGVELLGHVLEHGLLKTIERYEGMYHAKFAQMIDDMDMPERDEPQSMVQDNEMDMAEDLRSDAPESAIEEVVTDMADAPEAELIPSDEDQVADHNMADASPPESSHDDDESDMRDAPREPMGDDTMDGGEMDHKLEARLKKVYAAKLDEAKRAYEAKVAEVRAQAIKDYTRALRIVARRHALNLELSPLKEALGVSLANERTVGYDAYDRPVEFPGLPADLSMHLIEAAYADCGDGEINRLIERAAELAQQPTDFLKAAEADLNKLAHTVPAASAAAFGEQDLVAEQLRREANSGNLELRPQGSAAVGADTGLSAIKAGLSDTKVGRILTSTGR